MLPTDPQVVKTLVGELTGRAAPPSPSPTWPGRRGSRTATAGAARSTPPPSPASPPSSDGSSRRSQRRPAWPDARSWWSPRTPARTARRTPTRRTLPDYRIPFFATGPSVPAGTDVYALNPQLIKPGAAPGGVRRAAARAQRVRRQPGDHRARHAAGHRQHARLRSVVHRLRAVPLVSGREHHTDARLRRPAGRPADLRPAGRPGGQGPRPRGGDPLGDQPAPGARAGRRGARAGAGSSSR